ncbi:S10 family peptidase [Duganella qianjiadongensis]|uniref:Carboxypeptidase n=1 Tax=Duganella qianjiadongensis TaxID=2692176 RepID=A0ABW9VJX7_9BURK|nr:alpha/beta hydrolase [Duganella qianjiadongensis]MYM37922.1 carboxypeptidase [Duganella qianjiadongensis]
MKSSIKLLQFITTAALLASGTLHPASAGDAATTPSPASKAEDKLPEAKVWTSKHQISLAGKTFSYTASAGTMLMKNDKDEPIALFGYTAYVRDGKDDEQRLRPIVFAYNGGPGSSSAWLHMGIMGPKRTVVQDLEANTRGPFLTVDNEYTILDQADIVMIDPVGTGYSRPVGKGEGKEFWGVDQDIKSVADFIVKYVSQNKRWSSPKFVLGESYGGMRTAGVAYELLSKKNLALNGIILVSPFLDYSAGASESQLDTVYVNFLSTYAATAWYHHALAYRPAELQPFLREVEAFARDVYAPVLFKGRRASAEERQQVLRGLARYTGISEQYWERANLRIDEGHFVQELKRTTGRVVARIDSRYQGEILSPLAESMKHDAYVSAIAPAFVASFNDYYRRELKVDAEREYAFSGDVGKDWDFRHAQPDVGDRVTQPNTSVDLAWSMKLNPKMKVLIATGYYDLACPYGTVEYVLDHLDLTPELRNNIGVDYYEAGHMMYVHPASMIKFKRALAGFVDANSR